MTNKTITLSRELVERAVMRPGKESLAVNNADIIARGRAQAEIRELLADPVPPVGVDLVECDACPTSGGCVGKCMKAPVGGDVKVLPERKPGGQWLDDGSGHASDWHEDPDANGWNAACDAWAPHVTRLQAEVERLKDQLADAKATANLAATNLKEFKEDHRSELAKARELLADVAKTPWMYDVLGSVREFLSNQSAPADTCCGSCPAGCVLPAKSTFAQRWLTDLPRRHPWTDDQSAPSDKGQGQGEPVGLQHMAVAEDGKLRWMSGRKMQNCELYALPDGSAIRFPLYAEQPAPVAVVMPERLAIQSHWPEWKINGAEGWNACLDEFTRLNSEPKP